MVTLPRAALVVAALSLACTPRIWINRTEPAPYALPQNPRFTLDVVSDGAPQTPESVIGAGIALTQGQLMNKWLAVQPVRESFLSQLQANQLTVVEPQQANVLIRVKPTEWSYQVDSRGHGSGRLDALVEIYDATQPNSPPVYKDSFWASNGGNEPDAMVGAARRLANRVISDFYPHRVSEEVELDDSDPVVKPGIELCKDDQFDLAYQAFTDIVTKNPSSAPALYDYAVLAESRGEYDKAMQLLQMATHIAQKPIYYEAQQRVQAAANDAKVMQQ